MVRGAPASPGESRNTASVLIGTRHVHRVHGDHVARDRWPRRATPAHSAHPDHVSKRACMYI
eukprot:9651-Prymnesium_polylepis.1